MRKKETRKLEIKIKIDDTNEEREDDETEMIG